MTRTVSCAKTSDAANKTGLLDVKSASSTVLQTRVMTPDSMIIYIEDANRLVRVLMTVKDAMVRPIHQRRVAIAAVTDILRTNPKTHAEVSRDLVSKPYTPPFEEADTTEAAYEEPT